MISFEIVFGGQTGQIYRHYPEAVNVAVIWQLNLRLAAGRDRISVRVRTPPCLFLPNLYSDISERTIHRPITNFEATPVSLPLRDGNMA